MFTQGFYPKTHGITGNTLYDTKLGELGYSYDLYHYNSSIWPIWVSAWPNRENKNNTVNTMDAQCVFECLRLKNSLHLFAFNVFIAQTANEKAGKHSGCMMWPGSNFKYDDTACTFSQSFNQTMSWNERVDIVMTWFTNGKTPANLVMMYIEEPDVHAHIYSPDSNVVSFHGLLYSHLKKY